MGQTRSSHWSESKEDAVATDQGGAWAPGDLRGESGSRVSTLVLAGFQNGDLG